MGLPLEQLRPQLRAILSGASEREELRIDAVNRRGREFRCQVTFLPLGPLQDDGAGAAIMMIENVDA
jgi:two-component system CheB/CheR fusion protein